jgi:hypothetical protein
MVRASFGIIPDFIPGFRFKLDHRFTFLTQ